MANVVWLVAGSHLGFAIKKVNSRVTRSAGKYKKGFLWQGVF